DPYSEKRAPDRARLRPGVEEFPPRLRARSWYLIIQPDDGLHAITPYGSATQRSKDRISGGLYSAAMRNRHIHSRLAAGDRRAVSGTAKFDYCDDRLPHRI